MFSQICDNCGGNDLKECYERGDIVCMECGGCSPEKILDLGPEKYNHFGEKNHTRVSETDFYLSFSEQNTFIGNGRNEFQRMQNQLVPKTMSLSQSKMSKGFAITKKFECMFDLSGQIIDTVRNIIAEFQKAQTKRKKRINGTTSDEFVIAVIYMAFEIHRKGKNFKEVCVMSEVKEKKVRKFIKTINQTIPEKVKIHSR
jgi:transcription initiation factor TFIIIB Brf1 subunit/transcription initiation factor TFIIB